MLYGMEGGLAGAVRSLGPEVDVYAPIGDLVPGMSYLVRRLLENSSNESFVRQTTRHLDESKLLAAPVPVAPDAWWRRHDAVADLPAYAPEPVRRWHDEAERTAFARAVEKQATDARDLEIPAVVGGRRIATDDRLSSVDPGRIDHVVATSSDRRRGAGR